MCEFFQLLQEMQGLQVRIEPLTCNPGPRCWCNNLSFKFPVVQTEDCMSPQEMLDLYSKHLSEKDVRYLTSIKNRKFIRG